MAELIYTVGKYTAYLAYWKEYKKGISPWFQKLGKQDDYTGGIVFRARQEADAACPDGYISFGLRADWDIDTYSKDGNRYLIPDADLVWLDGEPEL